MILKSHRWIRGSRHDVGEPPKRKGILTRCRTVAEKIGDPGMMPESRQKDRGIQTQFQRAAKTIGDPDTMPKIASKMIGDLDMMSESCRNDKGFKHDAGEPPKR